MSFSMRQWTPADPSSPSPKRRQSDTAAISFDLPKAKRPRTTKSEGNMSEAVLRKSSLVAPGAQSTFEQVFQTLEMASSDPDVTFSLVAFNASQHNVSKSSNSIDSLKIPSSSVTQAHRIEVEAADESLRELDGVPDFAMTSPIDTMAEDRQPDNYTSDCSSVWSYLLEHKDIRRIVFGFLTACDQETFRPFYRQGMLRGYLAQPVVGAGKGCSETDSADIYNKREIVEDNVSFIESLVSRAFAEEYFETFYRHHCFSFDDPRAARWFFETIGVRNFSNLRKVEFKIYGGFDETSGNRNDLVSQSNEELWFNLFCWLKYRHTFNKLAIKVMKLPSQFWLSSKVRTRYLTRGEVEERERYVQKLPNSIAGLRGLKKATVDDQTRVIFPDRMDMYDAELCMQQSRQAYDPTTDMRNLPLSATLARIRGEAEEQHNIDYYEGKCTTVLPPIPVGSQLTQTRTTNHKRGGRHGRKKWQHSQAYTSEQSHILPPKPPANQSYTQAPQSVQKTTQRRQPKEVTRIKGITYLRGHHNPNQCNKRQGSEPHTGKSHSTQHTTNWEYQTTPRTSILTPTRQQQRGRPQGYYGRRRHIFGQQVGWQSGNYRIANMDMEEELASHWFRPGSWKAD